ncbi:MAG: hypothetical protein MUE51_12070 [Thermoleophilia bacterium]|nr:hypothetical protein [Thermoleophilia bacterium]
MKRIPKRPAVIAAAALAVGGLAVAGGTLAAGAGSGDPGADLAQALSARTGQTITAEQLRQAHLDVLKARLAQAVTDGRITQAQADQMLQRAQQGPGPGMFGRGFGMRGERHATREAVDKAAAAAIGITPAQLRAQLQQGKTMAQVAQSKGVAKQKVIDAISKVLQGAPANLTKAQADAEATRIVERTCDGPGGRGERGHHRGGFGGPMGPPPGAAPQQDGGSGSGSGTTTTPTYSS